MSSEKPFQVAESTSLGWPSALVIPSMRFRLFVAADLMGVAVDVIGKFAHTALSRAWSISVLGGLIARGFTT